MSRDVESRRKYILQSILQNICNIEDITDDWKKGVIIKLPKKGDLGDCNN